MMELSIRMEEQQPQKKKGEKRERNSPSEADESLVASPVPSGSGSPTQARVTATLNQQPSSIIIIIIISRYPNNPPAGATIQDQIIPG